MACRATQDGFCDKLDNVILPKNLTYIGHYAFAHTNINSIVIPEGVTSIEINTFSSCKNLVSVSLPETITAIGQSAFFLCEQLQTITIPSNITCIEPDAFYKCENLTSVTFENPTSWYITEDKNETQGSEIDVTNASDNAIRLTKKYSDYYWYQK